MTKVNKEKEARLTLDRLKELLDYCHERGEFTWKVGISNRIKTSTRSGTVNNSGYLVIQIDGAIHLAHRLVWFYHYGKFPDDLIDHIDGDALNNRIPNLRDVSATENNRNTKMRVDNTSGTTGVESWSYRDVNGKTYYYWKVRWYALCSGKRKSKQFSVLTYGNEGAKVLAESFKSAKNRELNTRGAGYTKRHGAQIRKEGMD